MIIPQKTRIFTELLINPIKTMRSILQKSIWTLALCIFATSVYAQVSPKKFKKAKGIEVTDIVTMPYARLFTFKDQDNNEYLLREDK